MPSNATSTTESSSPPPGASAKNGGSTILKPVFIPASIVIVGLIVFTIALSIVAEDSLAQWTTQANAIITNGVGWWYVVSLNLFLFFAVYCGVSRVGRIRLGRDGERPEFGIVPWFLMLFSAGMGIGLVFYGVAEPLSHYIVPPEAFGNAPGSDNAARETVGLTMLHWGLHAWGVYAVVGLGLAYMTFRRGRPLAVRWLLEPLIGRKRVEGWIGHLIDTVAVVGTLFGVATSFGLGVSQLVAGLEFLGWAEESNLLIFGLIAGITGVAVWSVVTGVHKGLKLLSNVNMMLAALLALTIFVLGPTVYLLQAFPQNLGMYARLLPATMLHTGAFAGDGWEATWTIFYWGWWTSWAPFVGMFIARISRGRTIREFVMGVLFAPTLVSVAWFTIFGDSAILRQQAEGDLLTANPDTGELAVDNTTALFQYLGTFPSFLPALLSVVSMIVIVFFFVTSSDSGSLVIDMLASGGNTDTPVVTRVYWAVLEGVAAAVLLVYGGSTALTALQTISISTAAPFSVILVFACVSLLRAFRYEVTTLHNYVEIDSPLVTDADPATQPDSDAGAPGALFGLRSASATYAGLNQEQRAAQEADYSRVVRFRPLDPTSVQSDPATGATMKVDTKNDPLAGETFDTAEFQESQEGVHNGGVADAAPGAGPTVEHDR